MDGECISVCLEDPPQDLNQIIAQQRDEICQLKRKLDSFNEVVCERDELRRLCCENDNFKNKIESDHRKLYTELLCMYNVQTENLHKVSNSECKWKSMYSELEVVNDNLMEELKIVKANECHLKSALEECEREKKCLQRELCCVKSELEQKKCEIQKLKSSLICLEDELCKVRKQLEECIGECNRLKEIIKALEAEINCLKTKLADEINRTKCLEEKLKSERQTFTEQIKIKCHKLNELDIKYHEICRKLIDEKCTTKLLTASLQELKEACERSNCEMKTQILRLKKENCALANELCYLRKKVDDWQRENNCCLLKVDEQRCRLKQKECKLNEMNVCYEKCEPEANCCSMKKCQYPSPNCCSIKKCQNPSQNCCTAIKGPTIGVCCDGAKNTNITFQKCEKEPCNLANNSSSNFIMDITKFKCELDNIKNDVERIRECQ